MKNSSLLHCITVSLVHLVLGLMTTTVLPHIGRLNGADLQVILASGSPRRKELISLMGITKFEVRVSSFAENLDKSLFSSPQEYCRATAIEKGNDVCKVLGLLPENTILVGADTIVSIDGSVLEKPTDDADSKRMISTLSGRQHDVHTAVVIYSNFHTTTEKNVARPLSLYKSFVVTSGVQFAQLTELDIDAYVASGEGKDKAGSYGIQGLGGQMVESINGCYFNVMGLPIHALSKSLAELLQGAPL
jgi:septum formation protein